MMSEKEVRAELTSVLERLKETRNNFSKEKFHVRKYQLRLDIAECVGQKQSLYNVLQESDPELKF